MLCLVKLRKPRQKIPPPSHLFSGALVLPFSCEMLVEAYDDLVWAPSTPKLELTTIKGQ